MNIDNIVKETEAGMQDAIAHLEKAFMQIRAGRANPAMLGSVMVDYYGNPTPLSQVANVSAPDAMTLSVQPWESSMIQPIEKAIMEANLGFNPSNNGNSVIINVPPLTEERRKDLAKQAKAEAEQTKVTVRNARQDGMKELKNLEGISEDVIKDNEANIQTITNNYIAKIEEHLKLKETDIMKI